MLNKVIEIISEKLSIDASLINRNSRVIEDLGLDSLDLVELVIALEDEIGTAIPNDVLQNIETIDDVVKFLEKNS